MVSGILCVWAFLCKSNQSDSAFFVVVVGLTVCLLFMELAVSVAVSE